MHTQTIQYEDKGTLLEGFLAYQESTKARPAILIAHDWSGRNEFACNKAKQLAELGYIGFALDMFGQGIIGKTNEEKQNLIKPFMSDRASLQRRILRALETLQQQTAVDRNKIAAIGFCFGGLCVLDLARSGADIQGVVSFHGLFNPPETNAKTKIKAKILVLHGFDDPMANPEQLVAFGQEMTARGADWQAHLYGNTMHAFTNPNANDKNFGTVYDSKADERSWTAMQNFFKELFG